jgi:hypothetical protein
MNSRELASGSLDFMRKRAFFDQSNQSQTISKRGHVQDDVKRTASYLWKSRVQSKKFFFCF